MHQSIRKRVDREFQIFVKLVKLGKNCWNVTWFDKNEHIIDITFVKFYDTGTDKVGKRINEKKRKKKKNWKENL